MTKQITDLTNVLTDKKRTDRINLVRGVAVDVKQSFPELSNVDVMRAIYSASNVGNLRERLTKDEVWSAVADAAVTVAVNSEVAK
ncbi:TPA: hypothetical protein IGM85_004388 [Escherichia coli]|nr:hypothetical protein [Salmonella enterica subsp. enterica serovar Newport]EFA4637394.1 hypothetical protein [Escherichia coli]EKC5823999.1 hypothetical protein [Salmonella enterica subsp. enterica]EDI0969746.1 hypothetical protein [Salmonella enterica subsp. enterica serovar Newport]HAN7820400.1 hypothetical protein [Escherichia coli]